MEKEASPVKSCLRKLGLTIFLVDSAVRLNRSLRAIDWGLHRAYGGCLQNFSARTNGVSLLAIALFEVVLAFAVLSPSLSALGDYRALALMIVVGLGGVGICIRFAERGLVVAQVAYTLFVLLLVWLLSSSVWGILDAPSLPNSFMVYLAILCAIVLLVALPVSCVLFSSIDTEPLNQGLLLSEPEPNRMALYEEELREHMGVKGVFRSAFIGLKLYPIRLLLLPALLVVVPAPREQMLIWAGCGFCFSFVLLVLSTLHPGLNSVMSLTVRAFFRGAQGVISLILILLALGRLLEFSYVDTLLESSPARVVASYIVLAYVTAWLYEYWTNRLVSERFLGLFDSGSPLKKATSYISLTSLHRSSQQNMQPRSLQIHGGSRCAMVFSCSKQTENTNSSNQCFEVYGRSEFLEQLAGDCQENRALSDLIWTKSAEIENRFQSYFAVLGVVVLLATAFFWKSVGNVAEVPAVSIAHNNLLFEGPSLRELVFNKTEGNPQSVLLLAASGGGSRAALYTTSVLRGLWASGLVNDLVLISSVSGGSGATAYFASFRPQLKLSANEAAWSRFEEVMSQPFIEDVLVNVWDLRVMMGRRLGHLLEESFRRRFYQGIDTETLPLRLGDDRSIGLILNSAIAGHEELDKGFATSYRAGGILSFTNLSGPGFPQESLVEIPGELLTYAVAASNTVELTKAAAVSANFPPVFPNAAVDLGVDRRYWVTDGGAVENRGVLSALFALRRALEDERRQVLHDEQISGQVSYSKRTLPRITLLVAEASAENPDFYQDRGLSTSMSASRKIVNQLVIELWNQVVGIYQDLGGSRDDLTLANLPMPMLLRSNGGIGTHWMLPSEVTLRHKGLAEGGKEMEEELHLTTRQARALLVSLYSEPESQGELAPELKSPEVVKARQWIASDENYRAVWQSVIESHGGVGPR